MKNQIRKILESQLTRLKETDLLLPEEDRMDPHQALVESMKLHLEIARSEGNADEIKEFEEAVQIAEEIKSSEEAMSTSSKGVRDTFREWLDGLEEEMRQLKKQHDKSSPSKQTSSPESNQAEPSNPDDGDNA